MEGRAAVAPRLLGSSDVTTRRLPRLALTGLFAAASASGCSFLFASAPPDNHEKLYEFDCTTGNVLPVVDSVIATVYGIGTAGMLADKSDPPSTVATMAVAVAAFGASAVLGFRRTSDCREARAKLSVRLDALRRAEPRPTAGNDGDWAPSASDPWLDPGPAAPVVSGPRDAGVAPAASPGPAPPPVPAKARPADPDSERTQPNPKED